VVILVSSADCGSTSASLQGSSAPSSRKKDKRKLTIFIACKDSTQKGAIPWQKVFYRPADKKISGYIYIESFAALYNAFLLDLSKKKPLPLLEAAL
jgi:hypothetical protein